MKKLLIFLLLFSFSSPTIEATTRRRPARARTVVSKVLVQADLISELSGLAASAPVALVKECECFYYYDSSIPAWVRLTTKISSVTSPLTLSSGALASQAASGSQNGYLQSSDWTTFSAKQSAGNYITAITGDAAATGPGSAGLTFATVNSNTGTFGSASVVPVLTVNAKGLITAVSTAAIPSAPARAQAAATRSFNSAFQVSSTRDSLVSYSVDVAAAISLTSGQTGTVFLEMASDSGFTTNVQEVGRFVNGNTGTLTIGLNLTQNVTGNLTGFIPAGFFVRLRTANTAGTPTFAYRSGQEVLL